MKKRLFFTFLTVSLLCSCAGPVPKEAATPTPAEETVTPTPEPTQNPAFAWLGDPDEIAEHVTVEGFYHRPVEELPQELRDSLTLEGDVETEQGYSFHLRTYTAPGLELVTTEAPPEVLDEYLEGILAGWQESGESWEDYAGWLHCPTPEAFQEEIEGEKGREWLYSATFRDDSYETPFGLKVGLTVEEAEELGYQIGRASCRERVS